MQFEGYFVSVDDSFTEFLAFFSSMGSGVRARAGRTVDSILSAKQVWVVPQSRRSFLSGLELYRARPDKRFSLVDCVSMQVMRREGIQRALTNDEHFVQEGFEALFRVDA
jgi:predicted nucleic acid-binding protein